MSWIQSALVVGEGAVEMYGQHEAEREEKRNALYTSAQLRRNAGQAQAASQRTAEDKRRQTDLLISRARALAGGGAGDVSVLNNVGDIAHEGELQALSALYEGDVAAQAMRERADQRMRESKAYGKAARVGYYTTIFKTASKLYSSYASG